MSPVEEACRWNQVGLIYTQQYQLYALLPKREPRLLQATAIASFRRGYFR